MYMLFQKSAKIAPLKPKYEIINGKIAPPSPTRSNNSSMAFDGDISNLYERQIEVYYSVCSANFMVLILIYLQFVDGYLMDNPFINEDIDQNFEQKPPKIAKREDSYHRNRNLEDLRTRVEIQCMRAKTAYFKKQIENLDIERSVMLLKAKKLELEVEQLRKEAQESTVQIRPK